MKKMKRIMAGLLSLLLVFSLAACSGGEDKASFQMDVQEVYQQLIALWGWITPSVSRRSLP